MKENDLEVMIYRINIFTDVMTTEDLFGLMSVKAANMVAVNTA